MHKWRWQFHSVPRGDGTLSDPYAGTTVPSTPAPPCTVANTSSGTLGPGRYCGLNVTSNLTLTGGVYIFDCDQTSCPKVQGQTVMLSVKGATLTDNGAGTTLVFTCSTCTSASRWPDQALSTLANGNMCLDRTNTEHSNNKRFRDHGRSLPAPRHYVYHVRPTPKPIWTGRCMSRVATSPGAGTQQPARRSVPVTLVPGEPLSAGHCQPVDHEWHFQFQWPGLLQPCRRWHRAKADRQHSHACAMNNESSERNKMSSKDHIRERTALRQAFRRLMSGEEGAALVEATIIAPILVIMGVYASDFGLLFYNKMEVQNAAQAGAQWAITNRVYNGTAIQAAAAKSHTPSSGSVTVTRSAVLTHGDCDTQIPSETRAVTQLASGTSSRHDGMSSNSTCNSSGVLGNYVTVTAAPHPHTIRSFPLYNLIVRLPRIPRQRRCAFNETKANMG